MNKEFILEKIKEFRGLVIGIALSVILAGGYYFRTSPMDQLMVESEDLTKEVRQLGVNHRNGATLEDNLVSIREMTAEMESRLISENLADIHDIFYQLEKSNDVKLESVERPKKTSDPIKPKLNDVEYQPLQMTVSISGSYKNVIKFLHDLENEPLLYRYSALNLKPNKSLTSGNAVSLNLTLELLSLNES